MHVVWRVGHATYFEIVLQPWQTGGQVNILVDIFSLSIMRGKAICLCIYSSVTDLAHTINLEVQAMFVIPLRCLWLMWSPFSVSTCWPAHEKIRAQSTWKPAFAKIFCSLHLPSASVKERNRSVKEAFEQRLQMQGWFHFTKKSQENGNWSVGRMWLCGCCSFDSGGTNHVLCEDPMWVGDGCHLCHADLPVGGGRVCGGPLLQRSQADNEERAMWSEAAGHCFHAR